MALSDTQQIILSQASQRDDGLAVPPERLLAAARQTLAKSLFKQGPVSTAHAGAVDVRDAWQIDGHTHLLRITEAGMRAIGVEMDTDVASLAMSIPPLPTAMAAMGSPYGQRICPTPMTSCCGSTRRWRRRSAS